MIVHRAATGVAATAALIAMASCGTDSKQVTAEPAPATSTAAFAPSASPNTEPDDNAHGSACVLRDMGLSLGEGRSAGRTGERSISLRFTNDGENVCALNGRPSVEFLDSSARSVLREDENGNGRRYVHATGKTAIQLKPGSSAEVVIAKYRCDLGDKAVASRLRIGLPEAEDTVTLVTDPNILRRFSSCRGSDEDPGQTFAISGYTPFKCRVVGNATGGGWCDGDLERPFTQTLEEAERAGEKEELARQHAEAAGIDPNQYSPGDKGEGTNERTVQL